MSLKAPQLAGRRLLARAVLLFEAVWPALWPAAAVIGLFVCAALLDLPERLPPWLHLLLLVAIAGAVLVLGIRGLRGIRLPDDRAADRRLETRSGLIHRPLSVLTTGRLAVTAWPLRCGRRTPQERWRRSGS